MSSRAGGTQQRRLTATLVLKPTWRRSPQLGEYSISCIAAFLDLAHTATTPPPPSPPPAHLVNDRTDTEAAAQEGGEVDDLQAGTRRKHANTSYLGVSVDIGLPQ